MLLEKALLEKWLKYNVNCTIKSISTINKELYALIFFATAKKVYNLQMKFQCQMQKVINILFYEIRKKTGEIP